MSLHSSGTLTSLEADAWSTIADAYPAMLFMASANGTMEWANRRCHDVTGVPRDLDPSQFWPSVVHPAHLSEILASWQHATATGEQPQRDREHKARRVEREGRIHLIPSLTRRRSARSRA